jgi:hypothetical protein
MSIEKIKEILIKDCQLHEHRGCECNPASADDCWGELAKELSALIEQARKEERQKMIDEGWISPEECNACNKRQIESERILNREAAFDEERLRDEVKYWKSKNYQLGS